MSTKLSLLIYFFTLAGTAFGGLDLSSAPGERVLDGIKFEQLIFRDGDHKITYEPPRGWRRSGDSAQLKLTPPDVSHAQAVIDHSPLAAPQAFKDETIKELQAKSLKYAPPGSNDVAIVSEEKNPILLNRHETYGITVSYHFGNQDYLMNVLYVNLPETQLRFRFVSRKAEFEKLFRSFRGSVFSWQWAAKRAAAVAASN